MGPYDCVLCDGDYMRPLCQSSPPTRLIIDPLDVDNNDDKDDNDDQHFVCGASVALSTGGRRGGSSIGRGPPLQSVS